MPDHQTSFPAAPDPVTRWIDHIPVLYIEPVIRRPDTQLALWIPGFSTTKESSIPMLNRLADAGFVAMTFDLWQHGQRGSESQAEIYTRVFSAFRRYMWPILGQSTLDAMRLIDWAIANLKVSADVVAGGTSLGGDIAVALAGIDTRVSRVAAIVGSPDWLRPGMHSVVDPEELVDQGVPDAYAQWFYDRLNPFAHLEAYATGSFIAFELGAQDTNIPSAAAYRFRDELKDLNPAIEDRIRIAVHEGVEHKDGGRTEEILVRAVNWLDHTDF